MDSCKRCKAVELEIAKEELRKKILGDIWQSKEYKAFDKKIHNSYVASAMLVERQGKYVSDELKRRLKKAKKS